MNPPSSNMTSIANVTTTPTLSSTSTVSNHDTFVASPKTTPSCMAPQIPSLNASMTALRMSPTSLSTVTPNTSLPLTTTFFNFVNTSTLGQNVMSLSGNTSVSSKSTSSCTLPLSCARVSHAGKLTSKPATISLLPNTGVSSSATSSTLFSSTGNKVHTASPSLSQRFAGLSTSSTCTSSKYETEDDKVEYARIGRALNDLGSDILADLLEKNIQPYFLRYQVQNDCILQRKLSKEQREKIVDNPNTRYKDLDVSCLCIILSNIRGIKPPKSQWHNEKMPNSFETTIGDDIKRIRILRNKYCHAGKTSEVGRESSVYWSELYGICSRLDSLYRTNYLGSLKKIRTTDMDSGAKRKHDSDIRVVKEERDVKKQKLLKIELLKRGELILKGHKELHNKKNIVNRKNLERACLRTVRREKLLIITGKPGSGKSTLSVEIIHQLTERSGVNVYVLKEADEWIEINQYDDEAFILIEDFCDNNISKNNDIENWRDFIDEIDSARRDKKASIIINIDYNILNALQHDISKFFIREQPFNISEKWSLTFYEKKMYFDKILSSSEEKYVVSKKEKEKICSSQPVMGFFNACLAFFKYAENYQLGSDYFKTLEKDYSESIEFMISNNFQKYTVLLCLLLNETNDGNSVDVKMYDEICSLFHIESQTQEIAKESIHGLRRMNFIKESDVCDSYRFVNTQIHVSLLESVKKRKSNILLEYGTKTFIFKRLRSSRYKPHPGEICMRIGLDEDDAFATLLLGFFDINHIRHELNDLCLGHPTCCEEYFRSMLFNKMKDKFKDDKNEDYFYDILDWSCLKGCLYITEETLSTLDGLNMITPNVIEKALKLLTLRGKQCQQAVLTLTSYDKIEHVSEICCFDLIRKSDSLQLDFNTVSRIVTAMKLSDNTLTDFITDSIDEATVSTESKKHIIKLSLQVSTVDLIKVICRFVDNELHNDTDILMILLNIMSDLSPVTDRNTAFEEMLKRLLGSHVESPVYVTVLRKWMDNQIDSDISARENFIFIKPMKKEWYTEFLNDEFIQRILQRLEKTSLASILRISLIENVEERCLKTFLSRATKVFDGKDVINLLVYFLEIESKFSKYLNILIETPLLRMRLDKDVARLINRCAQIISHKSSLVLQKFILIIILSSASYLPLDTFFSSSSTMLANSEEDISFLQFENLFKIHRGISLSEKYLRNLSHCILDAFMMFMEHNEKREKIPPIIGHHIARIALDSNEESQLLSKLLFVKDKEFRSAVIYTLLEGSNNQPERTKPVIEKMISFISSDTYEITCNCLIMVVVTTLQMINKFCEPKRIFFELIRSTLQFNEVRHDVLQCILMKCVEYHVIGEMPYDLGKLLLKELTKTKEPPRITSHSIFKILQHACSAKFINKNLLKLLVKKSDVNDLRKKKPKILLILRKAIRCKSYLVVNIMVRNRMLQCISNNANSKFSSTEINTLCSCYLMLFMHTYRKRRFLFMMEDWEFSEEWKQFLGLQEQFISIDEFLRATIRRYSLVGAVEVSLIMELSTERGVYIDLSDFLIDFENSPPRNRKIKKNIYFRYLEMLGFDLFCMNLFKSGLISLDTDILVTTMACILDGSCYYSSFNDAHLRLQAFDTLCTFNFVGSISRYDAYHLGICILTTTSELPESAIFFFIESVLPSLLCTDIMRFLTLKFKNTSALKELVYFISKSYEGVSLEDNETLFETLEDTWCISRYECDKIVLYKRIPRQSSEPIKTEIKCSSTLFVEVIQSIDIQLEQFPFLEQVLNILFSFRCNDMTYQDAYTIFRSLIQLTLPFPDVLYSSIDSTVFPSLTYLRHITDVLILCFDFPLGNNLTYAFAKYLHDKSQGNCIYIFIEYFRKMANDSRKLRHLLLFVNTYDKLITYAENALVYHICRCLPEENYKELDLISEDPFVRPPLLTMVNMLLVLRWRREKYLQSHMRYEIAMNPQDYTGSFEPTTIEIRNKSKFELEVVKDNNRVCLVVNVHQDHYIATLHDEIHLSSDDFASFVLSAFACTEIEHVEQGMIDVFCLVYQGLGDYNVDGKFSLLTIRVIDLILLYLTHPTLSKRNDMLDCLRQRFISSEQQWRKQNGMDKQDFVPAIDDMLENVKRCDINAVASHIGRFNMRKLNVFWIINLISLSIFRTVCNRKQTILHYIYLLEKENFDYEPYFGFQEAVLKETLGHLSGFEAALCLEFFIKKSSKCEYSQRFINETFLFHSSQDLSEWRRDFLTYFIDTWKGKKYTEKETLRYNSLKILLANKGVQKIIHNEINSSRQLLSSECIIVYLKGCVYNKEWDHVEMFIQHRSITSGVVRHTIFEIVESMSDKGNPDAKIKSLSVTVESSKMIELHTEDLLDIVLKLEESEIPQKFKHIETIVSSQMKHQNNSDILNLIVDFLHLNDYCDSETKVIHMDVERPTSMIFLSSLLLKIMPMHRRETVPWNDKYKLAEYQLRNTQTNSVFITISSKSDPWGDGHYEVRSHLEDSHSEDYVMNILFTFLASKYDLTGILCFLLNSLPFKISAPCWTQMLLTVIRQSIDSVCGTDMLNEMDLAEPSTRRLRLFLATKHGESELIHTDVESLLKESIRSYVNSSSIISVLLDHYCNVQMDEVNLVHLFSIAIETRYIRSVDYIETFIAAARICDLGEEKTATLIRLCLKSSDDQSETLRVILSCCLDEDVKKRVLNLELLSSLAINEIKNPSNLNIIIQNHDILNDDTILTSVIISASRNISEDACSMKIRKISFDKCKGADKIFVRLMHLYFLRYHHSRVYEIKACQLPCDKESIEKIVVTYEGDIFLEVDLTYSSLLSCTFIDTKCADVKIYTKTNIQSVRSWQPKLINMSLKAIGTEQCVNPIVLILYETTEKVKLSDDELQMLFCAMINRKYAGREDYIHSLLSSPMYSGICEKSATEILRTATCKQRNNTAIIDLFVKEAEKCGVLLSEPNVKLLISDLCECRHKRTVFYLRKLLQSPITPEGLSDDVFIAALTSYLRDKEEKSEIVSFLKEYKTDVSENLRDLLEKLKSDTQDESDDEDDENEDDDDSIKSYKKGEIERKTKIIDDIIASYFSMETD